MNEQKKNEKHHTTFVDSTAFLDPNEYRELLASWVTKGEMVWRSKPRIKDSRWREEFARRLVDKRWRDAAISSMRRSSETERDEFCRLWEHADNDPLNFLNLAGVPPLRILGHLEYWKTRKEALQKLRTRVRSDSARRHDAKWLKKTANILDYYKPFFIALKSMDHAPEPTAEEIRNMSAAEFQKLEVRRTETSFVPAEYLTGEYLRRISRLINDPEKLEILTSKMHKKGGPKVGSSLAVKGLVDLCESALSDKDVEGPGELYAILAKRSLFGLVAGLVNAAFPEWFKTARGRIKEAPIRNLKNAYRAKIDSWL
jgi:hypothetical protein